MDVMQQRVIQQLLIDLGQVQRNLGRLAGEHFAWSRECRREDLGRLIGLVSRLEEDVSLILVECMTLSCRQPSDGLWPILIHLLQAYSTLNTLFDGLTKSRQALEEARNRPEELEKLTIDWGRFQKLVSMMQEHLQGIDAEFQLRKANVVSPSSARRGERPGRSPAAWDLPGRFTAGKGASPATDD